MIRFKQFLQESRLGKTELVILRDSALGGYSMSDALGRERWIKALESLIEKDLIKETKINSEFYKITEKGIKLINKNTNLKTEIKRRKKERKDMFVDDPFKIEAVTKHGNSFRTPSINVFGEKLFGQIKKEKDGWHGEIRYRNTGKIKRYAGIWKSKKDVIEEIEHILKRK